MNSWLQEQDFSAEGHGGPTAPLSIQVLTTMRCLKASIVWVVCQESQVHMVGLCHCKGIKYRTASYRSTHCRKVLQICMYAKTCHLHLCVAQHMHCELLICNISR